MTTHFEMTMCFPMTTMTMICTDFAMHVDHLIQVRSGHSARHEALAFRNRPHVCNSVLKHAASVTSKPKESFTLTEYATSTCRFLRFLFFLWSCRLCGRAFFTLLHREREREREREMLHKARESVDLLIW